MKKEIRKKEKEAESVKKEEKKENEWNLTMTSLMGLHHLVEKNEKWFFSLGGVLKNESQLCVVETVLDVFHLKCPFKWKNEFVLFHG